MSSESQDYIRQGLHADAHFNDLAREAAILFSDLVGSTEFKRHHTSLEGLAKTALHNAVVTDLIVTFDGKVSKYLGDGVLGVFEGDDASVKVIKAAAAIILGIEDANRKQHWEDFPRAMSTRIGIHCGPVWMFRFPQATTDDPQGTVVDIASRLVGLAGTQQIVITDKAFQAAAQQAGLKFQQDAIKSVELGVDVGPVVMRLIKGVNEPIAIRSAAPHEREPGEILLLGHRRPSDPRVIDRVAQARTLLQSGTEEDLQRALETLQDVVKDDPGNFEANVRAAQILLHKKPNGYEDERANLDGAIHHLSLAKQIRPESWRVWHLASWTRYRRFQLLRDLKDLERAVGFAQTALERADDMMDIHGVLQAKVCLAWKLLVRSEWVSTNTESDLARAADLCRDVSKDVHNAQGVLLADYLYTHAAVRLSQHDQDYVGIEKMIKEAEQANQWSDKLFVTTAKLREIKCPQPTGPIL